MCLGSPLLPSRRLSVKINQIEIDIHLNKVLISLTTAELNVALFFFDPLVSDLFGSTTTTVASSSVGARVNVTVDGDGAEV